MNSDENEIFLNNNSYNIGCDICGLGYTLPFTTNIFDFINNKCKNIHDLKITNQTECSDNNLILEDYYICTNKDYFKKLENISNNINKQINIYKISKNNNIVKETKTKINTCFQYFDNTKFKKNNILNIKEVIICENCANWIKFIDEKIYNSLIHINPIKLFWRYFFKNNIKYITFKNIHEKKYILRELNLENINKLKDIIIN